MGSSDCAATVMPAPPRSAPPPPTLLKTPRAIVNSPRAPPIAAKPRPISSQDSSDRLLRELEISSSDWTATNIPAPPRRAPPPPILLRAPSAMETSPNAPPIPARPRAISSQDIPAKLPTASASILHAWATARMATLVLSVTLFPEIFLMASTRPPMPAPTPTRPFASSSRFSLPIFSTAEARIFTASAIAIMAIDALSTPLLSNRSRAFITSDKPPTSSPIMAPIAISDPVTAAGSIVLSLPMEMVSTPIAAAMVRSVPALMPLVNALMDSPTLSRRSVMFSLISEKDPPSLSPPPVSLSITSLIVPKRSPSFFVARNVPPPARPANRPVAPKFSDINENASPRPSLITPANSRILEPTVPTVSPKLVNIPITVLPASAIPVNTVVKALPKDLSP